MSTFFSDQAINEVDSLVLIQLVALTTTMHSIGGENNDPVLILELAITYNNREYRYSNESTI